ncbi:hypothetical protein RS022_06560 [Candidatus Phytoplasma rubi]|uniref:DUF2963 domain-containing protein n=1 Tax=Candidatus Phytoplasma rubi TaxID=399025 RepID=A0ABY7BUP7_9MOLU|nr:DUF2963 domain-containing protein [Candidatus Phytoplasma rubi]WAN63491.1 hypothetical protein RS022_06560 [Candidatus Phytoplasma rubi]
MKTTKKEFIDNYGYKVIQEYDKDTGTSIKDIFYQLDGKTIHYIDEYDKATSNIIKKLCIDLMEKLLTMHMNTIKSIVTCLNILNINLME